MNNVKWISVTILLLAIVGVLSVSKYLDFSNLHNQWIVVYPGDKTAFVEYRISLYDLRALISGSNLNLKQAVTQMLTEQLEIHHRKPRGCKIDNILGSLQSGVLVQANCQEFVGD